MHQRIDRRNFKSNNETTITNSLKLFVLFYLLKLLLAEKLSMCRHWSILHTVLANEIF